MKFAFRWLLLGSCCLLLASLSAQIPSDRMQTARTLFQYGQYRAALQQLTGDRLLLRNDPTAQLLTARCYYQLNRLTEAETVLQQLLTDRRAPAEATLYLGQLYHARHEFAPAATQYKTYLRSLRADSPERRRVVEDIRRCDNGQRMQFLPTRTVVENAGPTINGEGDEFGPVFSPLSAGRLYFSSRRDGNAGGRRNAQGQPDHELGYAYSDMYSSQRRGSGWESASPLHFLLNSPKHEIICDFSADGQVLYFFQGWSMDNGTVLTDTFQRIGERQLRTVPIDFAFSSAQGDCTPFFFQDSIILFSSRRPGGYGGLDVYWTRRRSGQWTPPQNLGPVINSAFDEVTPFLSADGLTLYYSTNDSRRSVGGFDVVMTKYRPLSDSWAAPQHLGMPVNSAGDDTYFRLARDGYTGAFSSDRKDGMGSRDLYLAYYQDFRAEMTPPMAAAPQPGLRPAPGEGVPISPVAVPTVATASTPPTPVPLPTAAPPTAAPPLPGQLPEFLFRFSNQELPGDGSTRARLDNLVAILQQSPDTRLVVSSYSNLPTAIFLFEAAKRAESIAAYFTTRGIHADRLTLRAQVRERQAKQVLVRVINDEAISTPATASRSQPEEPTLHYKVQFVSVSRAYDGDLTTRHPHPMIETRLGLGYYRYTVGQFATHAAAVAFRQQLIDGGQRGPFVVAYLQGERLTNEQAQQWRSQFPDLGHYLGQK